MNPNKKVLFTFLSFVMAMLVIACSCSSLIPAIPTPTVVPSPTNPMLGLAGTWHNQDTSDVYEIALQGGQYVVTSVTWEGTSYGITSQSWSGGSLTWSYFDSDLNLTVTLTTTSLSGGNLYVNYSLSDGSTGTAILYPGGVSVISTPQSSNQEAISGLAGTWQDPATSDTYVIAWQNGQYVVTSVTWEGTNYDITSQSWTGGTLTWSYYDSDLSMTVTHSTTSLSGDSLYASWSYSDGSSGTETLQRGGASAISTPQTNSQEAMPGLAGTWQDPDTSDQFVIAWQNGQYVVTSVTWEGTSYDITAQSWIGDTLTWSYYDSDLSSTVTHTTTSLSGDSLNATWSYSDGRTGTETLQRQGGGVSVMPVP